jgi:hypothetical protein
MQFVPPPHPKETHACAHKILNRNNVWISMRPCQCSHDEALVSHFGALDSTPNDVRDLCWTIWQWSRFLSEFLWFSPANQSTISPYSSLPRQGSTLSHPQYLSLGLHLWNHHIAGSRVRKLVFPSMCMSDSRDQKCNREPYSLMALFLIGHCLWISYRKLLYYCLILR